MVEEKRAVEDREEEDVVDDNSKNLIWSRVQIWLRNSSELVEGAVSGKNNEQGRSDSQKMEKAVSSPDYAWDAWDRSPSCTCSCIRVFVFYCEPVISCICIAVFLNWQARTFFLAQRR